MEYFWFNHTYTQNPKQETGGRGRQAVAQLKPNAWGLYDMLGNVWMVQRPSLERGDRRGLAAGHARRIVAFGRLPLHGRRP